MQKIAYKEVYMVNLFQTVHSFVSENPAQNNFVNSQSVFCTRISFRRKNFSISSNFSGFQLLFRAILALLFAFALVSCNPPSDSSDEKGDTKTPLKLSFGQSAVIKSKMLYETQKSEQTYTNKLLVNGKPAKLGDVSYKITKPESYTGSINLNKKTGTLTFKNTPETITVEATHAQGSTASYTLTVADHFSKRRGHSSVVIGSGANAAIYVIGGFDGTNYLNDVWKSSNGGATWTEVALTSGTKFSARDGHSSVAIGSGPHEGIYVIGGFDGTSRLDDVWKSSDGGETWTEVALTSGTKFSARDGHSSVAIGSGPHKGIYVIGGFDGTGDLNNVWKSSNGGATWQVATGSKFSERSTHSSVVVGSNIYVIGGRNDTGHSGIQASIWESSNGGGAWRFVNSVDDIAVSAHSSVAIGTDIYVIGGIRKIRRSSVYSNEVQKSKNRGATWNKVNTGTTGANTLFPARDFHSSVAVGSDIYVIGGAEDATNNFNDVWKSTDGGVTWVNVHAKP